MEISFEGYKYMYFLFRLNWNKGSKRAGQNLLSDHSLPECLHSPEVPASIPDA
jgi:hypothetical protein